MNLFEKEALVQDAAERFEHETPEALLAWAVEKFPNITLACSFGAEDVVLVDMLQNQPGHGYFLSGYRFSLSRRRTKPAIGWPKIRDRVHSCATGADAGRAGAQYGDELWKRDPNACCNIRKVEPLTDILANMTPGSPAFAAIRRRLGRTPRKWNTIASSD